MASVIPRPAPAGAKPLTVPPTRFCLAWASSGAGSLEGDLTPQCTAALAAVLESLGAKAGPEDVRTKGQRDHDALEEVCRRLIAAEGRRM